MKLTRNFDLDEFIRSETAEKLGIDNTPPEKFENNIKYLCTKLLQPLRSLYGKPMIISSGFRCKELNEAVGGVETSFHTVGLAADIKCENPKALLSLLISSRIMFDQAILYPTFLHLSLNHCANRQQVIRNETNR